MKKNIVLFLGVALGLCSCVRNNVPYPVIDPAAKVSVEGAKEVLVNHNNHTITAVLEETTDICKVKVSSLEIESPDNQTVTVCEPPMVGTWDLSSTKEFLFRNYPDCSYKWTLDAKQEILRYFSVEGQIGNSVIDAENHRVVVYVNKKVRLSNVIVKSIKLGPEGISTYSKGTETVWNFLPHQDEQGNLIDYETVDVTAHGRSQKWLVYAEKSEVNVSWDSVDAWSRCAWLSANGLEGSTNGFCYRAVGAQEWINVNPADITFEGGRFTACLDGLQPLSEYEAYAFCDEEFTETASFTTEGIDEIPNGGFNVFSHAESASYFSFFDPAGALWSQKWWDSGNSGSTAVGESGIICTPDTEDKVEGEASARLNSKYVVIKFAAGNIFSGEFAGLVGTKGGKVNFGRPWTTRPRALRMSIKTICGPIDHMDSQIEGVHMGDPDIAEIYIALGDWDYKKYGGTAQSPVQVNTTEPSSAFDPEGANVIAYGKYSSSKTSDGWIDIEIPLEYRSHSRKPSHIIISCASSKYGDFFVGSSQNTMWVDNMKLVY